MPAFEDDMTHSRHSDKDMSSQTSPPPKEPQAPTTPGSGEAPEPEPSDSPTDDPTRPSNPA